MTKLIEFEISGLAGRQEIQGAKLDPDLNVFWGLNGSGKTSMLRILDAALNNEADGLEDVAFESARVVFYSEVDGAILERTLDAFENRRSLKDSGSLELRERYLEPDRILRSRYLDGSFNGWKTKVLQGDPDQRTDLSYNHSYLPISRLNDIQQKRWSRSLSPASIEYDEFNFADDIEHAWRQYNSESLSQIREIQQKGLADILSVLFQSPGDSPEGHVASLDGAEHAYSLVLGFLISQGVNLQIDKLGFTNKYRQQPELQLVVQKIRRVNEEIAETTKSQRAFQDIIASLYDGDKRITFSRDSRIEFHFGRRRVGLNRLSSGEKQLLRILLTTLAASTAPVLIDEPELSMHVDWQRRLVKSMKSVNPGCQLILATHSPEVIATVAPRHVFEL